MASGGGRADGRRRRVFFFPVLLLLLLSTLLPAVVAGCFGVPVIFNFGDSNSDTGGLTGGLGYNFGSPYGRVFFHRPTGRPCDGRLVLDFLCGSLNASFLSPYMESLGSQYRNGADFAVSGSSILPRDLPFSLKIQVQQFTHFRSRSIELIKQGSRNLIDQEGFNNALYMFDIGQNDLSNAFSLNLSYAKIVEIIPIMISEIENAINKIHEQGGRKFWIHNTGPLGCLPKELSMNRRRGSRRLLDAVGCVKLLNSAAIEFNTRLESLCQLLRSKLRDSTIVYTDMYAIKYEIVSNYARYGFENPFLTCCGFGGPPYNYNVNVTCGNPGHNACPEGSSRVSWDGIHYTEAANAIVAQKILSGNYSSPRAKFSDSFCNIHNL